MRTQLFGLAALALTAVASPALAQQEPPSDFTVTGGATVVSDYRFRGISQTDKRFAVQGTFTVAHASGLYATVWGSSIDDYVAAGADQEIDFVIGYSKTLGATTIDGGLLYYYYPGSGGVSSDFFEPYISVKHTLGPVTGKLSAAYAWKQNAISIGNGREDNLYLAGDLSAGIPQTPISVSAHLGYSNGPSFLIPTSPAHPNNDDYLDWSLGATYTWNHLTFGVSYVDTDISNVRSPSGRDITKAGVVFSLGVAF